MHDLAGRLPATTDLANAADPRPVLPYRSPLPPGPRHPPGDQMAFGFGCLTSVLAAVLGPVYIVAILPSRRVGWAVATVTAVQVSIGLALGLRGRRWGYLKGVGWSVVALTVVVAVLFCLAGL